jgi:poly(ADP-ribose) glycohydrolase ARH3
VTPDLDHVEGCLLGLALGDALGAPFEGGVVERLVWRAIGRTRSREMRWTDDTQMSLDIVESLVSSGRVDQDDLATRFAASYRWSRGYGPGTAKLLKRVARGVGWAEASRAVYPDGSFGNGAAMRSPIIGLFFAGRPDDLVDAARKAALVTHAHPLGVEGAVLVAAASAGLALGDAANAVLARTKNLCNEPAFTTRLDIAKEWLDLGSEVTPTEVRKRLGHGVAAAESCVTALYVAMRFRTAPYLEMHRFVVALGGDVDTIGAMAGAMWGASNGATLLPEAAMGRLEQRERVRGAASALHKSISARETGSTLGRESSDR